MLMHGGTQERLIAEVTTGAGSTVREGSIQSDSLLATLYVNAVTSGSLTVTISTLTDAGKELEIISFPAVTGATTNLLLKKAAISLQRYKVQAVYTGICDYEIYVRAVEGAGEASARILGSDSLVTSQATVNSTPAPLIPSSLTDRTGLVIKHWGGAGNLYVSESLAKLPGEAYPMGPRDALALDISAGVTVYAMSDGDPLDIRIAEAGGG